MGYDVHITRAEEWTESEAHPITLEEWQALVLDDPELGPDPDNGPTDFLFLAHPDGASSLWWYRGEVYTKDPDRHTIRKMITISEHLGARVQGDDFRVYTDWHSYVEPQAGAWDRAEVPRVSYWRKLFRR